jgi:hypothetical protein
VTLNPEPIPETAPRSTIDALALLTAGQRRTNLLLEVTQALIACAVVTTGLYVAARLSLLALQKDPAMSGVANGAFVFITSTVSLVIGFYFGRNHQRLGEATVRRGDAATP